jgi:hypothetical protein
MCVRWHRHTLGPLPPPPTPRLTVVLEGTLPLMFYGGMLRALCEDSGLRCTLFYLDVSLEETQRRHAGREKAKSFGPEALEKW